MAGATDMSSGRRGTGPPPVRHPIPRTEGPRGMGTATPQAGPGGRWTVMIRWQGSVPEPR